MVESGPNCPIFPVMENITLHHNLKHVPNSSLWCSNEVHLCVRPESPDKPTGACVSVCVCPQLYVSFRFYNICEYTGKMACIPWKAVRAEGRKQECKIWLPLHSVGQGFWCIIEQRRKEFLRVAWNGSFFSWKSESGGVVGSGEGESKRGKINLNATILPKSQNTVVLLFVWKKWVYRTALFFNSLTSTEKGHPFCLY